MLTAGYIDSLAEPGCSRAHGAIAEGHHDKAHFAALVSLEYAREINPADVVHGYRRNMPGRMHLTTNKGRGALSVTWVEW